MLSNMNTARQNKAIPDKINILQALQHYFCLVAYCVITTKELRAQTHLCLHANTEKKLDENKKKILHAVDLPHTNTYTLSNGCAISDFVVHSQNCLFKLEKQMHCACITTETRGAK